MNVLSLIRQKQIKDQRRFEAEMLMAKAYRGVAYTDAHHDEPASEPHTCTYRGSAYNA